MVNRKILLPQTIVGEAGLTVQVYDYKPKGVCRGSSRYNWLAAVSAY
jgi:hypothetical protein